MSRCLRGLDVCVGANEGVTPFHVVLAVILISFVDDIILIYLVS